MGCQIGVEEKGWEGVITKREREAGIECVMMHLTERMMPLCLQVYSFYRSFTNINNINVQSISWDALLPRVLKLPCVLCECGDRPFP